MGIRYKVRIEAFVRDGGGDIDYDFTNPSDRTMELSGWTAEGRARETFAFWRGAIASDAVRQLVIKETGHDGDERPLYIELQLVRAQGLSTGDGKFVPILDDVIDVDGFEAEP